MVRTDDSPLIDHLKTFAAVSSGENDADDALSHSSPQRTRPVLMPEKSIRNELCKCSTQERETETTTRFYSNSIAIVFDTTFAAVDQLQMETVLADAAAEQRTLRILVDAQALPIE